MKKIDGVNDTVIERISTILVSNGLQLTDDLIDKLDIYYNYLVEYNKNVNLTAITEKNDVYLKHFADSMLGIKYFKTDSSLCDIGTGAGFPGVVIKIVRPDIKLTLVDSLNKRVEFLKELASKLHLTDVVVLHNRAEDVDFKAKYLNSFDYVTARAVAGLSTLSEYCLPFVKVGGQFIAYKSSNIAEEFAESKKAIKVLGGGEYSCEEQKLDNDTIRNFVLVNKISNTLPKYPRGQNKPKLSPIK